MDLVAIAEFMTNKAVCTEAGMFALREQRVHVTQVMKKDMNSNTSLQRLWK